MFDNHTSQYFIPSEGSKNLEVGNYHVSETGKQQRLTITARRSVDLYGGYEERPNDI